MYLSYSSGYHQFGGQHNVMVCCSPPKAALTTEYVCQISTHEQYHYEYFYGGIVNTNTMYGICSLSTITCGGVLKLFSICM